MPLRSFARRLSLPAVTLVVCVGSLGRGGGIAAREQDTGGSRPEGLHGIISKSQLSPPLQSRLRALRFSPDGSRILLQDESTLYILTRNPLAIEIAAPARYALPSRFSADSTAIVVATRDMGVQRWNIAEKKAIDARKLGDGTDCFLAALSPAGTYYACIDMRSNLHVFQVLNGDEVFTTRLGDNLAPDARFIEPFHIGLPRSEPFGYFLGGAFPPPLERVAASSNIKFSPDERYVVAVGTSRSLVAADLRARRKINMGGPLNHAAQHNELEFVAADRVAVVSHGNEDDSAVVSFPDGRILNRLGMAGDAEPTSDSRYLVHATRGDKQAELVNIEMHQTVARVSNDGTDILGSQIASYTVGAGLLLAELRPDAKRTLARIAAGPLPLLHTALASPNLGSLVIATDGQSALYRVSSGAQVASFPDLRGAWFDAEDRAVVRVPGADPLDSTFKSLNTSSGETGDLWTRQDEFIKDESLFSGSVVLAGYMREVMLRYGGNRVGYELRAFDPRNGKKLWSHDYGGNPPRVGFQDEPPVTFTDPQGERVVVGWDATSDMAREAVKHNAVARQNMKLKKVTDHDTVFQVFDARTGNVVGAAFVPGGSGPQGYTSAYSAGNWLVVVKDGMRVTAVSLADGDERLHLTARSSAISAKEGLLAVTDDGGRFNLYDLVAGARRDTYTFPENILYTRFSEDGKRLLVLTEYQTVYVIDAAPGDASATSP